MFKTASLQDFSALCRGFVFTSPWRSLATQGCYAALTAPVADADRMDGDFQRQLRQHFIDARRHGIAHPIIVGAIPFDVTQPAALFIPEFHQSFDRADLTPADLDRHSPAPPKISRRVALPDHAVFTNMVAQAVAATQRGELDKVVLSRLLDIVAEQPVDTAAMMRRIVAQNPNSYNFHLPLPQGGVLMGASPELLMRKQGGDFISCPLAGSARRETDGARDRQAGDNLMNSDKDRYEHGVVTRAMKNLLADRSMSLRVPESPELITTPTLWHLATRIEGTVKHAHENALSLACLLHPTPALSGFPPQAANELIAQLEPFDRQWFGGIVGWSDAEGNGEWVVTIRCASITDNHMRLFAGAGIVPASSPENEWQETGLKLSTMLNVFGLH
ncbi:isochorismate synthase [Sodalis sp. RH21]|uniref:isochorismate synthase n=1 Tax=unclassified Sodalis (in: enterobacteria) TaxID=2636512 RepID=UPI0039B568B8